MRREQRELLAALERRFDIGLPTPRASSPRPPLYMPQRLLHRLRRRPPAHYEQTAPSHRPLSHMNPHQLRQAAPPRSPNPRNRSKKKVWDGPIQRPTAQVVLASVVRDVLDESWVSETEDRPEPSNRDIADYKACWIAMPCTLTRRDFLPPIPENLKPEHVRFRRMPKGPKEPDHRNWNKAMAAYASKPFVMREAEAHVGSVQEGEVMERILSRVEYLFKWTKSIPKIKLHAKRSANVIKVDQTCVF